MARRRSDRDAPTPDVFDTGDGYRVEIDLPGVPPAEVELTATDRTLTVAGSLPDAPGAGVVSCHRERVRGPFRRVLEFAEPINPGRVRAEYRPASGRMEWGTSSGRAT